MDELAILYWEVAMLLVLYPERRFAIWVLFVLENLSYWAMDAQPSMWMLYHPAHGVVDIAVVLGATSEALRAGLTRTFVKVLALGMGCIVVALTGWCLDMFMCDSMKFYYLHAYGWHLFAALAIACLHIELGLLLSRRAGRTTLECCGFVLSVD